MFWLEKVAGVKHQDARFLINSLTDLLLKREMDEFRGVEAHHWVALKDLDHLIPLDHKDLEDWTDSLQFGASPKKYNTLHEPTNILFGGGIDDMWLNTQTGEYTLVDFQKHRKFEGRGPKIIWTVLTKLPTNAKWICICGLANNAAIQCQKIHIFLYVDGMNQAEYEGTVAVNII